MKISCVLIYLIVVNILGFSSAALDKRFAKLHMQRISEKSLFAVALFGGALFMYISMRIFKHKTLHKRFMIGLPVIFTIQLALFVFCRFYGLLY